MSLYGYNEIKIEYAYHEIFLIQAKRKFEAANIFAVFWQQTLLAGTGTRDRNITQTNFDDIFSTIDMSEE